MGCNSSKIQVVNIPDLLANGSLGGKTCQAQLLTSLILKLTLDRRKQQVFKVSTCPHNCRCLDVSSSLIKYYEKKILRRSYLAEFHSTVIKGQGELGKAELCDIIGLLCQCFCRI